MREAHISNVKAGRKTTFSTSGMAILLVALASGGNQTLAEPEPDHTGAESGAGFNTSIAANPAPSAKSPPRRRPGIWQPDPGTTWQWQLAGVLDTSVEAQMYDIDLFDTSPAQIAALQRAGRIVICYFSAGSSESWRSDFSRLAASSIGQPLDGWPDERWLDFRTSNVQQIMLDRLDLAAAKGCDGVEPDNVDGYDHHSGFNLTRDEQIDYLRFLSREAHARGLSIGLKNVPALVDILQPDFDWALNEECLTHDECQALYPFLDAGKAVFHTEYVANLGQGASRLQTVCTHPDVTRFSTLIKMLDLGPWRLACEE